MQARIEGEERVIGDVASSSPSLVSLTLRGYFYGKGGARLISCPEFRTSGNLHPWVHINVEEEQRGRGRGWRSGGEAWKGWRNSGHGREKERGARKIASFERHFSMLPALPATVPLFRPLSSVFFDGEEDRKRFSIRASRPVIDCLYRGFDSRGQRTPPLVFIESRGLKGTRWRFHIYTFALRCRRRRTTEEEADTGKGRLISWTLDGKMGEE